VQGNISILDWCNRDGNELRNSRISITI